eukprot:403353429
MKKSTIILPEEMKLFDKKSQAKYLECLRDNLNIQIQQRTKEDTNSDILRKRIKEFQQSPRFYQSCFDFMLGEIQKDKQSKLQRLKFQKLNQNREYQETSAHSRRLEEDLYIIEIYDQVITEEYFTIQNNGYTQFLFSDQPNVKIHIRNSSFTCQSDYPSYKSPEYSGNRLSLFQIENAVEILVEDTTFQNCYTADQGAVFNIKNSTLTIQGQTVFQNNSAVSGGVIYAQNSNLFLQNVTFDQNMAIQGGTLYLENVIDATFIDTTILSGFAQQQGAFLYTQLSDEELAYLDEPEDSDEIPILPYYSKIQFLGSLFMNNTENKQFGGSLFIDNKFMDVVINGSSRVDSKFINIYEDWNYYKNHANFAVIADCNIFYVNNMTATHLSSYKRNMGLFISAEQYPVKIIISNSDISAKSGDVGEMELGDDGCYDRSWYANSGSFVTARWESFVTSINNTFKQNDYAYGAGVFSINGGTFFDENSNYKDINSDDTVYLSCYNCYSITIKNITMRSNMQSCSWGGSLINLEGLYGELYIDGLDMQGMKTIGYNNALISAYYWDLPFNVTFRNIVSLNQQITSFSTGLFSASSMDNLILENIYVEFGYSRSFHEIYVQAGSNLFAKNITFLGKAEQTSTGMGIDYLSLISIGSFTHVLMEDTGQICSNYIATQEEMFKNTKTIDEELVALDTVQYAYFCQVIGVTNFHSRNSYYKNCYDSINYFGFYCTNCENFTDENSIYENLSNIRSKTNLGVYYLQAQNVNITNNTFKNIVVNSNALMNFTGSYNSFIFDQNTVQDVYSKQNAGLIKIVNLTENMQEFKLKITNSNFSNIYSEKLGTIIYLNSVYPPQEIAFINCVILKITTEYRGAVIYSEGINSANLVFENNKISDLFAIQGGALFDFQSNIANITLTNMYLECLTNQSFINDAFDNAQILDYSFGPAIIVKNSIGIFTSINSTFRQCINSAKGSVMYFYNSSISTISNSTFIKNHANQGSSIYCELCDLTIIDSQFINNSANIGGVIFTDNKVNIQITNLTAINNQASDIGGFLCVQKTDVVSQEMSNIHIKDSYQIDKNSATRGGLIYLKNIKAQLVIQNSSIGQQQALIEGGALYISEAQQVRISNCKIFSSLASAGGMIYTAARDASIYLEDSTIDCQNRMSGTQLYIKDTLKMNSLRNTYQNCKNVLKSGIYILEKSNMEDVNSTYTNNYGLTGGVFLLFSSNLTIQNSNFTKNSANQGGVFQVSQDSFLNISLSKFDNNSADKSSGVIFLTSNSTLYIEGSLFINNKAQEASVIEILGSNTAKYVQIVNSTFRNNSAVKNTMSIKYSKTIFQNCRFIDNQAERQSKNIYVGMTTIAIENCVFNNSISNFNEKLSLVANEKAIGAFLSAIYDVNITISNSSFENGIAYQGGALQIAGNSQANISNSTFQNNVAMFLGGAIYATRYNEFNISDCQFLDNYGRDYGDDLYIQNSEHLITITQSYFRNTIGKQAIYADNALIKLINLRFEDIRDTSIDQLNLGGAVLFYNCILLEIKHCEFKNLTAYKGGAIYIWESEGSKNQTADYKSSQKYKITNSTFANCSSSNGGAVYLQNPQSLLIQNTTFFNNSALKLDNVGNTGNGGAIFYTCVDYKGLCSVQISDNTKFVLNQASIQGGAIYWNEKEPIINQTILMQSLTHLQAESLMFTNNSAGQYGDNVASFPQRLAVINESVYNNQLIQQGVITHDDLQRMRRQLQQQSQDKVRNLGDVNNYQQSQIDQLETILSQFRSGGSINTTYLAIVDKYGQIIGSDYSSIVRVFVNSTYNSNPQANIYPPIVEGTNTFNAQAGVVKLENVMFYSTPGYNQSIVILNDGINLKKESNINLMNQLNKTDLNYRLKIALRKCSMGEQFTQAGKCTECNPGYSLKNMSEPSICDECPDQKAFCHGGAFIGPKPGFWRKSYYTDTIIQCLYQPACLGMLSPNFNPKGDCYEGYQGILCADCQNDFSRAGEFQCQKCPANELNVVRLFFTLLGVLLLLILMIRSTLMSAHDKTNIANIFQKILMNHFQLLMMASSFEFEWSQQLVDFFTQTRQAATVSTQIISLDCFLDRKNNEDGTVTDNRVFFVKLVLIAFLPLAMSVICVITWYIIKIALQGKKIDILNRSVSSIVIVLFLIHPSVILYMFYNFKCKDIDGEMRIRNDLEIECWSDQHKYYSFYFAIPSIIVWGLGIPLAAFVILFYRRKALDTFEIRQRYGFLYRGFKQSFYYWEIVNMYRKISILFVSVFISSFGVIAQALAVFAILIIFLMINLQKQPYSTHELNNLETMSIVTSMLTIYCGMFFVLDRPKSWIDQNPDYAKGAVALPDVIRNLFFALILASNFIFFAYWIVKMFEQMRAKIRTTCTQVYLTCFLCLNTQKLKKESEDYVISKEHSIYYEDALKVMQELEDLYKSGKLILNKHNIQRLQLYLNPDKIFNIFEQIQKQTEKTNQQAEFNLHQENAKNNPENQAALRLYSSQQLQEKQQKDEEFDQIQRSQKRSTRSYINRERAYQMFGKQVEDESNSNSFKQGKEDLKTTKSNSQTRLNKVLFHRNSQLDSSQNIKDIVEINMIISELEKKKKALTINTKLPSQVDLSGVYGSPVRKSIMITQDIELIKKPLKKSNKSSNQAIKKSRFYKRNGFV